MQEDKRKSLSHELQDEIAQTLLGINVRILTLKQQACSNTKRLEDGIASTRRLVIKSGGVRAPGRRENHKRMKPKLLL